MQKKWNCFFATMVVIVDLVIYVLSVGPAMVLYQRSGDLHGLSQVIRFTYFPLFWLSHYSAAFCMLMMTYLELWGFEVD